MIYQWKAGTQVPEGATPDGVLAERSLIRERQNSTTTDASFQEIETHPADFPNIRAFFPQSAEEAWEVAAKIAIRTAYRSVEIIHPEQPGRPVRAIYAIRHHGSEDREFKTLAEIREDPKDLKALVDDLRYEAASYARKLESVLAEVAAAVGL